MPKQSIHSRQTKALLFGGNFESYKDCLEQAVSDRVNLAGADLRNLNLSNACLDDGLFAGADFSGANLTGANLSEACLRSACFENADLYNTCFAYGDLRKCLFSNAGFGATDITGADISNAHFSALSCFSLDFASTASMNGCHYKTESGREFSFSAPPVVVRGLGKKPLVFTDTFWLLGSQDFPCSAHFHPIGFLSPAASRNA